MMRVLSQLLPGPDSIPPHVAVGSVDPQQAVAVSLHGLSTSLDVTTNAVVVSLRPLLFAVGFTSSEQLESEIRSSNLSFEFRELSELDELLGTIHLKATGVVRMGEFDFFLFRATGFENNCLGMLQEKRYYAAEWWKFQRKPDPYNFYMAPRDLFSHMVFYTVPRPVVLITTMYENQSNIFPMDLIGPTSSPYFLLALRTTSPSIPLMRESRKIVMSNIPVSYTDIAYQLGVHHKLSDIDWDTLPFETSSSVNFGFPTPVDSLRVREQAVERVLEVGSHTLFITRTIGDGFRKSGLAMHHIQGFWEQRLRERDTADRLGIELPVAPVTFESPGG